MQEITTEQLYEQFIYTLSRCTSATRSLSDEELECCLFEDFSVGVWTFFHENSLVTLREAGFLNDGAVKSGMEIRRRWLSLEACPWTIEEVRQHPKWDEVFALCDSLMGDLTHRNPEQPGEL